MRNMLTFLFSRGHVTLHLAMSVDMSVCPSRFQIPSGFHITAPAQPSATGLPCIRPCLAFTGNFLITAPDQMLS